MGPIRSCAKAVGEKASEKTRTNAYLIMSASLQELRSIQRARSSEQNDGRDRRQHNNDGFEEALCDAVHEPQAEECAPDHSRNHQDIEGKRRAAKQTIPGVNRDLGHI